MGSLPGGGVRMSSRGRELEVLVQQLEQSFLKVPVRDATGLTGNYDFNLTFTPPNTPPTDDILPYPDLFSALQEELGLRADPKKLSIDVIVIDRAVKSLKRELNFLSPDSCKPRSECAGISAIDAANTSAGAGVPRWQNLLDERSQPEPMTVTVVNRKA